MDDRFVQQWLPEDLIVTTRKAVRDRAQKLLFEHHKKAFTNRPVPLLYYPRDTRRQNVQVPIPGSEDHQELVLNDVVQVSIEAAEGELSRAVTDWRFGYAMTAHSTQGLTVKNPQKVWIIDDNMQWSNLAYLAVWRVEYMSQLTRVVQPSEGDKAPALERQLTDQQLPFLRNMIAKKLVGYKRQDEAKGHKFDLKVKDVLALSECRVTQSPGTAARDALHAIFSCYGLMHLKTHSSGHWTELTIQEAT